MIEAIAGEKIEVGQAVYIGADGFAHVCEQVRRDLAEAITRSVSLPRHLCEADTPNPFLESLAEGDKIRQHLRSEIVVRMGAELDRQLGLFAPVSKEEEALILYGDPDAPKPQGVINACHLMEPDADTPLVVGEP